MFALPISMPSFKSIIFYQNSPKIKLFLQKNAKFSSAGGYVPYCKFLATRLNVRADTRMKRRLVAINNWS